MILSAVINIWAFVWWLFLLLLTKFSKKCLLTIYEEKFVTETPCGIKRLQLYWQLPANVSSSISYVLLTKRHFIIFVIFYFSIRLKNNFAFLYEKAYEKFNPLYLYWEQLHFLCPLLCCYLGQYYWNNDFLFISPPINIHISAIAWKKNNQSYAT